MGLTHESQHWSVPGAATVGATIKSAPPGSPSEFIVGVLMRRAVGWKRSDTKKGRQFGGEKKPNDLR